MQVVLKFDSEQGAWDVVSPQGVIIRSLIFEFPVSCQKSFDRAVSYPSGEPTILVKGEFDGKYFETKDVAIK